MGGNKQNLRIPVTGLVNKISYFMVDNEFALSKLSKVSINKMIEVIEQLDIQFDKASIIGADTGLLNYIFENNRYVLNIKMLNGMFGLLYQDNVEKLKTSNYTVILEVGYEPLLNRIYDNFESYVIKFVVGQDTNVDESLASVEDIIERLFDVNLDLCKSVMDKSNVVWECIDDCCVSLPEKKLERKAIWDYALTTGKVKEKRYNYLIYYNNYGLTRELEKWFSDNYELILQDNETADFTDELLKELVLADISLNSFRKIVKQYQMDSFNCEVSSLNEERLEVLIENNWIPFTLEYLNEIRQGATALVIAYIVHYKEIFMHNIKNVTLDIDLTSELFGNNNLDDSDKMQLMDLFIPEDIAMSIRNMEVKIKKEYAERAWDLLDESNRYQLLLNQLENYTINEISEKFKLLAPVYIAMSDISRRHKEYLDVTHYNRMLLQKLKKKGYITSFEEETYEKKDIITHQKQQFRHFGVWVKQRQKVVNK